MFICSSNRGGEDEPHEPPPSPILTTSLNPEGRIINGKLIKSPVSPTLIQNPPLIDTFIEDAKKVKVKEVRYLAAMMMNAEGAEQRERLAATSVETTTSVDTPSEITVQKFKPPENWINAPEFVPKGFYSAPAPPTTRSWADVVGQSCEESNVISNIPDGSAGGQLCAYNMVGECRFGESCMLVHGVMCDFCGQACLHPYDAVQRESHKKGCVEQHEKDMELSFAVARSNDKTCGICMEVVMEKSPTGEQRFGILPSCNHCFCLSCLRKWRQARQFENRIIRACPECRITSDFVCPSRFWVESKDEKDKLIRSYKIALSKKACRYYRSGSGECPFGNKCFYLHALPDGTRVDVGPPKRRPRRAPSEDSGSDNGPTSASIWDFLEDWELQWMDIEDFMEMLAEEGLSRSSSDDSDEDAL